MIQCSDEHTFVSVDLNVKEWIVKSIAESEYIKNHNQKPIDKGIFNLITTLIN